MALLVPDVGSVFGSAEEPRALSQTLPVLPLLPGLLLSTTAGFGEERISSKLGGGGRGGGVASAVKEAR